MKKYIKAETICNFIDGCLAHEDKITDIEKETLCAIKSFIERTPSADVRLVRYGKWIKQRNSFDLYGVEYFACDKCGFRCQLTYGFCPCCGADMRKEKRYGDCD